MAREDGDDDGDDDGDEEKQFAARCIMPHGVKSSNRASLLTKLKHFAKIARMRGQM
jgi:hypothetical protein